VFADPLYYKGLYTEDELIGVNFNNDPQSGNAINHPTGLGHYLFYYQAFLGIINRLTKKDRGVFIPKHLTGATWNVPDAPLSTVTNIGEKLYYRNLDIVIDLDNVALRRNDTYVYYTRNKIVQSTGNIALLGTGEFAYYYTDGVNQLIVSVPDSGDITWDMELFRYVP